MIKSSFSENRSTESEERSPKRAGVKRGRSNDVKCEKDSTDPNWKFCSYFENSTTGERTAESPFWQKFFDPTANANYWYNPKTREATWIPPASTGKSGGSARSKRYITAPRQKKKKRTKTVRRTLFSRQPRRSAARRRRKCKMK